MTQGDSFGSGQGYPDGGYDDNAYPVADRGEYAPAPQSGSGKVNWPTVLASAGVAAVISALILSIGIVGMMVSDNNNRADSARAAAQPTVVNLGAAQSPMQQANPGAAPAPAQGAAPQAPAPAPAPAEQVPASDGGAGSGDAPVAQAPQQTAPGAAAPQQPATQPTVAAPQALTPGQLNTKVRLIMNTGASRAARASELQAGARALGPVDQVAQMLRVSGAGFTYRIIGPVQLSGNSMSATLQMSLVGNGSRNRPMTWVWMDNKWKLSNKSTCDVASYALAPCSL